MKSDIDTIKIQFERETSIKKKLDLALDLSAYYRTHSRNDAALEAITSVLDLATKQNYRVGMARAYKEISLIHYSKLAMDKALNFGFQALTIFKSYGKNIEISEILCNIGVYYNALSLQEKARNYFEQSVTVNPENIAPLLNLGEYFVRKGEIPQAIELFKKTIKIAKKQNKTGDLAYAFKSLGEACHQQQRTDEAIGYFKQALTLIRDGEEEHTKAFVMLGLSAARLNQGKTELALENAFSALHIGERLKHNEIRWFSYKHLANCYEVIEDYPKANEFNKLSIRLHEKLYSAKITRRIAELEAVYEVEMKDMETRRLLEKSARLASIGTMTAGITHEINQPLNSIVINSEGILYKDDREKVLPEFYRQSVEKIFKSAQRIDQIIKHIRTYWNSGDDLIKSRAVNVNESIKDALGFLNQQIKSHGIDLETAYADDNPLILGNKVHLEQIIVNLITNSIHAVDKAAKRNKTIHIRTRLDSDRVLLLIEDNGIGLEPSALEDIFDPFYSTKKTSEGMGLGLSIVKNYVNQMNGEITLKNKKNAGIKISIEFPVYNEEK